MQEFITIVLHIKVIFRSHLLFGLALLLIGGFFLGKLVEKVKLPSITGYILAGLLLGESVLGLVPHVYEAPLIDFNIEESGEVIYEHLEHESKQSIHGEKNHDHGSHGHKNPLGNVTEVALGLIALTIGGEFSLSKLKKTGKAVLIMTITQLLLSFGTVSLFLFIFGFDLIFSLILGAIASATAPAATVAIIQSLNIKGKFVDYLYGIVALDDAGAVILFGIVLSVASSLLGSVAGEAVSVFSIMLASISEVVFSVVLGGVMGFILHTIISKRRKNITINERVIVSLAILLLSTAIAKSLHLSSLLTNMVMGGVLINLSGRNENIFNALSPLSTPIYAAFFSIAGTELDLSIFGNFEILMLGLVFVISRAMGKYVGIYLGSLLSYTDKLTRKYLGLCMIPQAGVAIGLSLIIQSNPIMSSNPYTPQVVSIVLFSVFINEIMGPPLSKFGVIKGTGITPQKCNLDINH